MGTCARRRSLSTPVVAALLVGVALVVGDQTVGSVSLRRLGWGLIGLLVLAYLVVEGRDGNRSSLES